MARKKRDPQKDLVFAKTDNQAKYISSIIDNTVTICCGPAGSGKSYITSGLACQYLRDNKISKILISRPLVTVGRSVGFLPGSIDEKISPFNCIMEEHFQEFLSKEEYISARRAKEIFYMPLETMRGATYKDTYMILDEAQNFTMDQIKMFLTRVGYGSKVVINGDLGQTDIKRNYYNETSGLGEVMDRLEGLKDVGICELDHDDIQRHSIISPILRALEQ